MTPPSVYLSSPGDQTSIAGTSVYVPLYAGDSDNYPLTLTVSGLPEGLTLNGNVISGPPRASGN